MCGIIGYTGKGKLSDILLHGLSRLEYRGYDSAGAVFLEGGAFSVVKAVGRLYNLEEKLTETTYTGDCGIAHTRWATHGVPSEVNSHPHGTERVQIVHNGIIENFTDIRSEVVGKGFVMKSQTDSEPLACLIDSFYDGCPITAIRKATEKAEGAYALGILFADKPGHIYAVCKDAPLIVSKNDDEGFIASDSLAIVKYTDKFVRLSDGQIAEVTSQNLNIFDIKNQPIEQNWEKISYDYSESGADGYPNFMLKEINEVPTAILKTVNPKISDGLPCFSDSDITNSLWESVSAVHIVACGTAMHAGLIGKHIIESTVRIPVTVHVASEFRYQDPILKNDELVIVISQSGETADSIAAINLAQSRGVKVLGIVNVLGSTISRLCDYVIYTNAGPEISVASTKAYSVQMAVLYLIAAKLLEVGGNVEGAKEIVAGILRSVEDIKQTLTLDEKLKAIAEVIHTAKNLFYVGRGVDSHLACEGSLKLKEITYIHSEAYPAGELKHGSIALISEEVPVVSVATCGSTFLKLVSNIQEVKARGAKTILLSTIGGDTPDGVDLKVDIPCQDERFSPFPTATAMHLVAYHTATLLGRDVDKPRNLAKSVTVE